MVSKIYFTFDCEDFINDRSLYALQRILELLHGHNIRGLFFITGHVAERLGNTHGVLDLLEEQTIGYHSTSHSVRPTIIEYTDVDEYDYARKISLERETKHINPITGNVEGKGGILLLKDLFPKHNITSYRAPGFAYSPPHIEALTELGIKCDFSTRLSKRAIYFKNITFYPYPIVIDYVRPTSYVRIMNALRRSYPIIFDFHPNYLVNDGYWDSVYFSGNPDKLFETKPKKRNEVETHFKRLESFFKKMCYFESLGMLEIEPSLGLGDTKQNFKTENILEEYQRSVKWVKEYLGYNPSHVYSHFLKYFEVSQHSK